MVYWISDNEKLMDIVIAAAGKGTRLNDYTAELPKHIIPIAGRPFLYYLLDAVLEAGFRRIFVVGSHFIDKLTQAIVDYDQPDSITVLKQDDRYGTACPLLAAESSLQGDRFVYTMGDHLLSAEDLQQMQQSTMYPLVAVTEHAEPQRYGVIEYNDDRTLARIIEKPDHPMSHDINVGLYTFTPDVFSLLKKLQPSQRGELEITDVINELALHQPVRTVRLQHPWMDLGRPEDITALESYLKHK